MAKRKTLAEQLAEAANPEPVDFDPEDFEAGAPNSDESSGSESEAEDRTSHYIDVGRSKLRDDGIALSEGKYKGERISRENLEEDSEGINDESEDESEDEAMNINEASKPKTEISQILNAEQKHLLSRLSTERDSDAQKGKAVAAQMQIYEKLLDMRIQAQKIITYTNKQTNEDSPASADKIYPLIQSVQRLRSKLSGSDQKLPEKEDEDEDESATASPSLDAMLEQNRNLDEQLRKKRENVLTKWSRKVELSSGRNALQSNRFRSLGQSAALQVNSVLTDMDRLVKRTKVDRSNYNLPESHYWLFDDSDFYRLLLKDLVDRRMADSTASSGLKWKTAANAVTKQKKNVDTKASKGRKLRYNVIDKIQGFDAPRNVFTWSEKQAEDLYSGLLGVKITMDDNENVSDAEGSDEEKVEIGEFNLFG